MIWESRAALKRALSIAILGCLLSSSASAAEVAKQDFDGGAVGLISGFDPGTQNLDGGPGDFFGVGNIAAWPQGFPPGVPFNFVDDSVISMSNPANEPFPADTEAVYGQLSDVDNDFFGVSDTGGIGDPSGPPYVATWTFDISGATDLTLSMDMGGIASPSFNGFPTDSLITFEYAIDGGASTMAFSIAPQPTLGGVYAYRAMDNETVTLSGLNGPLEATGANPVMKTLIDTGLAADNTVLDKSPATGTGAGSLDTFTTALNGTGSQLVLTLTANLPFEAMVFDNILIEGEVSAGLTGDFNGDLKVDAADYTVWRDNLGNPFTQDDYDDWKANFGAGTGSGGLAVSGVPEPTSLVLMLVGAVGLAFRLGRDC